MTAIDMEVSNITNQTVGVVAIGRNEGDRLRVCLESAKRSCDKVVYVDSGSTDGSVELAKNLGVTVVELNLKLPFTAARARNAGAKVLLETHPNIEAIQFVDGDCEIVDGWIAAAAEVMAGDPKIAVVCGRRRERHPDASIYNRLCDLEWNTPIGFAKSCGGDALIRVEAFTQVNGYDGTIIAGEEPEMCVRLRSADWKIDRVDREMTLHDAAMTRFGQWWTRNVRAGHAYAQGNALHGEAPEQFRIKEVRSITMWTLVPMILSLLMIILIGAISPRFCWIGLLPIGLYFVLGLKIYRDRRRKGLSGRDARLYAASTVLGKLPHYVGVRKFVAAQQRGQRTAIIEYKSAAPTK